MTAIEPFVAKQVKILTLDIETKPALVRTFGLFNQNIGLNQIVERGGMICFAAKWYGSPKVQFLSEFHHGQPTMLEGLWNLLDKADIVVGWNSKRFDIPHINREFILAGMGEPTPYKQVDLLLTTRRQFKFVSNKLDSIAQELGVGKKNSTGGFELWAKCMEGDAQAWSKMRAYNKQDVVVTEGVYDVLRPWISDHPNLSLYTGEEACNRCGGGIFEQGSSYTPQSRFAQFRCIVCGGWSRATKRDLGIDSKGITS